MHIRWRKDNLEVSRSRMSLVMNEDVVFDSLQQHWTDLMTSMSSKLDTAQANKLQRDILLDIVTRYNESHRFYHTERHISCMLHQLSEYTHVVEDPVLVKLAIIFHDIVYIPTSTTNEEDSANYFEDVMTRHDMLPFQSIEIVKYYILATKSHAICTQLPGFICSLDLEIFLDLDMEILSSSRERYQEYAGNIRKEYIHVDRSIYCKRRSQFLRDLLSSNKLIFSSQYFVKNESIARDNLNWECCQLEVGIIPGEF